MSQEWTEMQLFDLAGAPEPHARAHDPVSSELTVKSLGRDTSYNWRIFEAMMSLSERDELRHYDDGDSIAVHHDRPVSDDMILDWMERRYGRRYQRNVIARQRGLLQAAGWVQRVDSQLSLVILHTPTSAGIEAWHKHTRSQQ